MNKVGEYTLKIMKTASWYNNWLFSLMKQHISGEILEVGAGIGNFTNLLAVEGKTTAIDISEVALANLSNKFTQNVAVGYGDIELGKYYFKKKRFDTIVCLNVLEHIKKDTKALSNMNKLTSENGKLILLVPAHMGLFSEFDKKLGHFRRYRKHELVKKLESSGYKVKVARYINWWAAIGWFIFVKLTENTNLPHSKVSMFDKLGKLFLWPEKYLKLPFGLSLLVVASKK